MKSILNRSFVYTSAVNTDVRKTIAREKKRLALAKRLREEADAQRQVVAKRAIGGKP